MNKTLHNAQKPRHKTPETTTAKASAKKRPLSLRSRPRSRQKIATRPKQQIHTSTNLTPTPTHPTQTPINTTIITPHIQSHNILNHCSPILISRPRKTKYLRQNNNRFFSTTTTSEPTTPTVATTTAAPSFIIPPTQSQSPTQLSPSPSSHHLDPTLHPLHQYSPSSFFENIHQYTLEKIFYFDNPHGLTQLAKSLGQILKNPPQIQSNILLYGDLGTGKTTFSRYFLRELMHSPALQVVSPTFTLQVKYRHNRRQINHMDLYRLSHPNESHILNILHTYEDNELLGYEVNENEYNKNDGDNNNKSENNHVENGQENGHIVYTLPNTKSPHRAVNLIEWPHILHNSDYMPKSYIRIDLQDRITYKSVKISFFGEKYRKKYSFFENFENNHTFDDKKNPKNEDNLETVVQNNNNNPQNINKSPIQSDQYMDRFDSYIIERLSHDLGDLSKSRNYVEKLTNTIFFGDDYYDDDDNDENDNDENDNDDDYDDDNSVPTFIPRQFTNHRL